MQKMSHQAPRQNVTLDERKHIYTDTSGKNLIAVTRAIDMAGLIPRELKDAEAAERGSAVHLACALYDRKDVDTLRVHLVETAQHGTEGYLDGWTKFLKDTKFKVRQIELRLSDRAFGIAGTLDREGELNHRHAIVDLKSNEQGRVWPTAGIQMAGYAHMRKRGRRYQRVAVCLKPNGQYNCVIYPVEQLQSDLMDFFAAVRVARMRARLGLA